MLWLGGMAGWALWVGQGVWRCIRQTREHVREVEAMRKWRG